MQSSYRRLLERVRPHRGKLLLAFGASLLAAAAGALYPYLLGPLLKSLLVHSDIRLGPHRLTGDRLLWAFPVAVVGTATIRALAQWIYHGLMQSIGQQTLARFRIDLYAKLLDAPPQLLQNWHSGDLLSRFTSDLSQVEVAITYALTSYVIDGLQVIALLTVCWVIDRHLFVFAFVLLPGSVVPITRFARSLKKIARTLQGGLALLQRQVAEQLHNLSIVQAYQAEPQLLQSFDTDQKIYLGHMQRSLLLRGASTPTLEVLGFVGVAAVLHFGTRAIARDPDLAGRLLSFLAAALMLYQPLKAVTSTFSQVVQGVAAAGRLFEIEDLPSPSPEGRTLLPLQKEIRIEALGASYDGRTPILKGLSMVIPVGKKVALVGPSGAGKTTLFSILLRFLTPEAGTVLWDERPLAEAEVSSVRNQIAWVSQEPLLFSGTVRRNLLVGCAVASEGEMWNALRQAHAEEFVRTLPGGLDQEVGERGNRLSGGQKQRLAIARAFLKRPSLLLLDEPTSALDAESENQFQAGLRDLMIGRTTLVIAHRLATVRDADVIYVIESGAMVEHGSHDELISRQGRYSSLLRQGELIGEIG